MTDPMNAPYQ